MVGKIGVFGLNQCVGPGEGRRTASGAACPATTFRTLLPHQFGQFVRDGAVAMVLKGIGRRGFGSIRVGVARGTRGVPRVNLKTGAQGG